MRENSVPASPISTLSSASETAMLDAGTATAKKSVERMKHPFVANVLKESVGATNIIKCILDLGVNFIVDELLASASAVEKQLTRVISKNEAVQFLVNNLSSAKALEATRPYS